ncbi:MAG: amidase family protein, partial [Gammaproteobacteria bacterium]|nr:amidase family protein [Gammaproteobacteria bacterium]
DCSIEDTMNYALNMTNNTAQFDATGHPSISVPCGMEDDLPIGMMITGRHFDDLTVLKVADAVEKSGDWMTL